MRRRDVLRSGAGLASLAALGGLGTTTTAARAGYEPLGAVDIEGSAEAVVDDAGEFAFVAATNGFAVVDARDPAAPEVVYEERDLVPDGYDKELTVVFDVKYENDTLVVAGPANGGRPPRGFFVYDVSDSAAPERVAFVPTPTSIHNCDLEDGVCYVTGNGVSGSPIIGYDLTSCPYEEVLRWSPADYDSDWEGYARQTLHDLWVQDGVAYCAYWDAGTVLVDVSDPSDPTFVARLGDHSKEEILNWSGDEAAVEYLQPPGNAHYVAVNDDADLLFEGGESWDRDGTDDRGGPSGIDVWDISDPLSPEKLSEIKPPGAEDETYRGTWTTSHNFEVVGDRLYTSWYQGGVKVFDVSDPANPETLSWWADPEAAAFWTARPAAGGDVFVASTHEAPNADREALYVFPDEAGEMSEPPAAITNPDPIATAPEAEPAIETAASWSRPAATGDPADVAVCEGSQATTTTTTETTDATTPGTETTVATTPGTETTTSQAATSDGGSGGSPGFGVGATVAALGLGALARRLRREADE